MSQFSVIVKQQKAITLQSQLVLECGQCNRDSNKRGTKSKRFSSIQTLRNHISNAHRDLSKRERILSSHQLTVLENMIEGRVIV